MKTIHKYIATTFLVSFVITLLIVTFVISMGVISRITDMLAWGVSWRPVMQMYLCGIPVAVTFSIPVSALTASLLVFGRLSADGEISAMKACGIGMWQIIVMPVVVSLVLMSICLYLGDTLSPRSHYKSRMIMATIGSDSALKLLEEGRFVQDFHGFSLFIGRKKGNEIFNVRINDMRGKCKREIQAKKGVVRTDPITTNVVMYLEDVKVDPFSDDIKGPVFFAKWPLNIGNPIASGSYTPRQDDFTYIELVERIRHMAVYFPKQSVEELSRRKMVHAVELNKRLVLSLSCFAFVLLGVPLGVTAHRKESSIGIGISLLMVLSFYIFVIAAESIANRPELRPDLIIWMPVIIAVTVGTYLIDRTN